MGAVLAITAGGQRPPEPGSSGGRADYRPGDRVQRLSRPEIVLWCCIALLMVMLSYRRGQGARFVEDSYQYLNVASNIASGDGVRTSIIHYDTERAHGAVPAAMTTFPPGYPALIATVTWFGGSSEFGGFFWAAAPYIALFPLMAWAAPLLGISTWSARVSLALMASSAQASFYSTAILSESLFTFLSCGSILLYIRHEQERSHRPTEFSARRRLWLAAAATALASAAFLVRYAGLFLFAASVFYNGIKCLRRRDRDSLVSLGIVLGAAVPIGSVFARNVLLTGCWQGGNTKGVNNTVLPVFKAFGRAVVHILLGEDLELHRSTPLIVLALSAALLLCLTLGAWMRSGDSGRLRRPPAGIRLAALYVAVYCGAMIYLGVRSDITFNSRYFYPLTPLIILLAAIFADRLSKNCGLREIDRAIVSVWVVAAVCLMVMNIQNSRVQTSRGVHRAIARWFDIPGDLNGPTLRRWFDSTVPADAVIVAAAGQPTAYALNRKTISLIKTNLSDVKWSEAAVHKLMQDYRARYLILYPSDGESAPEQRESLFLASLLNGAPPNWLTPAAGNDFVRIFRLSGGDQSIMPGRISAESR